MRNGVDLERFVPEDREAARKQLALPIDGRLLVSVGHLIERKGHDIAISALLLLPEDVHLAVVGEGDQREKLQRLARDLGVTTRVTFAGARPQTELKWWYSAADALTLCSSREGWANVLLESMACGTPVIASRIWGTPEVVASPEAGILMNDRSATALAKAFEDLQANLPPRQATRCYAEGFSWEATTRAQLALFRDILDAPTRKSISA